MVENRVKSLDELEKEGWAPGPSPLESPVQEPGLLPGELFREPFAGQGKRSLDGIWQMAEGGSKKERLEGQWTDAIEASVPCSVHTALLEAGKIADPLVGLQDKEARAYSYREWWFKRQFQGGQDCSLLGFDGLCYRAHIWLNGTFLGTHSGMFGTPVFWVEGLLQERNELIVKLDNAPARPKPLSDFMDNDEGWHDGVVINCVYGWHYACLPSRGIWGSVWLGKGAGMEFETPFTAAMDAGEGIVDLCVKIRKGQGSGSLGAQFRPKNFQGSAWHFEAPWQGGEGDILHFRVRIPDPKLWWPNGMGGQNLYECRVRIQYQDGTWESCHTFGIRTIEMRPQPGGPDPKKYNWIYTVNGREIFVKGANWCTLDALLRFPRQRYERFLGLAKEQNIQLLRAWGGGMPETEDFYRLCDDYGIMVMQEWPTCWDSQKEQPFQELEETVLCHMPRLRNHPSLIMWCGGNESREADGEAMDMMARYAFELDGSRPFHRTSPWGGSLHNYGTYWEMQDMDVSLRLQAPFLGEFGMASVPNLESVEKYLPEDERSQWPADKYGSFAHHTPRFNQFDPCDMDYLSKHAAEFDTLDTMEGFIWATQMAQATAIRHTLESCRAAYPASTGVCYYKLTDVYPAASWSTIDYYGCPKLSYYILADSYEPLCGVVVFRSVRAGNGIAAPVYLLDDRDCLEGKAWSVCVKTWNRDLELLQTDCYQGFGAIEKTKRVGDYILSQDKAGGRLVLVTVEASVEGVMVHRMFYWLDYQWEPGVLRRLPRTVLEAKAGGDGEIFVQNRGNVPAVGVTLSCPGKGEVFSCSDNVFWLEAGESRCIRASRTDQVLTGAFNADWVPAG